ncbi:hypothetical protein MLD38_024921 [Melastoma candidum]|uniref:Uncharacterized protein n=1 Tax=Melastoma candidum TaxID=119954 RepID=A0ACB9NVH9_9MYRT|nr:hypothetical protein MLD38_024921 [Melastoma candidum]
MADQSVDYYFEDTTSLDQTDDFDGSSYSESSPSSRGSNEEEILQSGHLGTSEFRFSASLGSTNTRDMIMSYARSAVRELVEMARCDAPLWKLSDEVPNTSNLNLAEYYQVFRPMDPNLENPRKKARMRLPSYAASKETSCINIRPARLAASFMDLKEWSTIFASIVSGADILAVVSPGTHGTLDEATYLMTAEFHLPTTMVQSGASSFVRHCRMLGMHSWAITDFSVENLFPNEVYTYQIRPSGCLIESRPGRSSKVTVVQHYKEDNASLHHLYAPIVASGHAFCAKRWMQALTRTLEFTSHHNTPQSIAFKRDGDLCEFQRKGLMRLCERMLRAFFGEVNGSTTNSWRPVPLCGGNPLELMMNRCGVHILGNVEADSLAFSTSVFLPFPPLKVFEFLRDSTRRHKWDPLSKEEDMEEIAAMHTARDVRNKITIVRSKNGGKSPYFIENSFYTAMESYLVRAGIQPDSMGDILRGNSPDDVLILPSGFAILPSKPPVGDEHGEDRTLLTIAIQSNHEGRTQWNPAPRIDELEFNLLVMSETIQRIERGLAAKERAGSRRGRLHIG